MTAAEALLAHNYIQHNPGVPTGAAPVLGIIPVLEESGLTLTTHRTFTDGDLVVAQPDPTASEAVQVVELAGRVDRRPGVPQRSIGGEGGSPIRRSVGACWHHVPQAR